MKIIEFDLEKGSYEFELSGIETASHAHPAIEMVWSKNGGITIETTNKLVENIAFAIIGANIIHRIAAPKENVQVLMIECHPTFLKKISSQFDMELKEGIYTETNKTDRAALIKECFILGRNHKTLPTTNLRIQTCVNYLNSTVADYKEMIPILKSKVHLSESRLSHLFKEEMGLSIKKYLVWSRLKKAFELVINRKLNMYEAALQVGFYDQAHLSKAFKQMLGLNPSKVYNSRMLQE